MDPHHLQNNVNINMGVQGQPQQMNPQSQGQYNPQVILAQQQYMNSFNTFYGNNQMLSMDPFQQQQQQFLMMHSQGQQMSPMFQPQQPQTHAQVIQQQILTQQQNQQRFAQQQQVQQQQALHNHQQRLLEEQQRQMELARQQQQRQQQEEMIRQQRIKDVEEQQRQRELLAQREKERLEAIRQQEEAKRLAEEQHRKEEAERIRREELIRIRDEQIRKQRDAEQAQRDMLDRLNQVGNPLSLVATHFLTKYMNLIPFPSENMCGSKLPSVCDSNSMKGLLGTGDPAFVQMISQALSQVDVNDIRTRLDLHDSIPESNDLPFDQMPPLIKAVMDVNCNALDVEPEHNMEAPEHMLNDMELEAPARTIAATVTPLIHTAPSTSTGSVERVDTPSFVPPVQLEGRDASQLRRQMASVGKQPKASQQRKKKDMVECLYDSLTDYFDPSEGRRRRMRTRTLEEDQADQRDLELIAAMESGEHRLGEEGTSGASDEELSKFYDKKDRKKRKREDTIDRPPTPTEIIHQRDQEWSERQRKRQEKRRRRKGDDSDQECWNNDVMAENDSFTRFMALVDQIFDQVEDMDMMVMASNGKQIEDVDGDEDEEVSPELLIERYALDDLRNEVQKLKSWKKLNKVPCDRLVKLITMLERNMRDVISVDGSRLLVPIVLDDDGEEEDQTLRELVDDRLIRAADAACTSLMLMTSHKMPKQVLIEDAIDRAINLCKQYLKHIIFPASDSMFRTGKKQKAEDAKKRRKMINNNRSSTVQHIYARIAELMGCFSELVRVQQLPETSVHHLATMTIASFFVSNVGELQLQAMRLASNIFSRHDEHMRVGMLNDILNSLHRLPPGKNTNNSYRLGPEQWISNTSVLVMQLIQSVVKMPKRRKHDDESSKHELAPDTIVKDSFREAQRLSGVFLGGFLSKCSCKGNKSEGEEDYRRLFDGFLQDLLVALYKPEFPAAEMMLTILGSLLVKHYRTKATDITIRQASLDYLGSITARLRKDMRSAVEDSEKRMEIVVKTLIFEEQEEQQWSFVDEVDISELSTTDRLKKLEQALIDYLIERKGDGDLSVEYAVMFYAGEWYKETAEDLDMARQQFKANKNQEMSDKDRRKLEKKMERMNEKGDAMKEFLIKLVDRKHMRKRAENLRRLGNVMMESDAAWAVKYLASRREFSHSFEGYLKHILYGVTVETTVSLRTKAMRCLTQIIEADHEVLKMSDVHSAVNARMMDPNAAVREATIELLGKFLIVNEDVLPTYYPILLERIKDSGTAVRKRVIRIMREICDKYPNFEKIPEMLSKMVRRISDEDGVKKLVQETFLSLWFQPVNERNAVALLKKVMVMTLMVQHCSADQTVEYLEQLLQVLLKQSEKSVLHASKQIVDSLVDNVLVLENKMASDASAANVDGEDLSAAATQKTNQERLLACLTTLSLFSKVRPELMVRHAETLQPYLSMSVSTAAEQQVLNEVICMLERVVPLMSHPNETFLNSLDESLASLAMQSGMVIVASAVGCASAVWMKFGRKQPAMAQKFLFFLRNLNAVKQCYDQDSSYKLPPQRMPMLQRSVFSIGLLCRHFDFDSILEGDAEAARGVVDVQLSNCGNGSDEPEQDEEHSVSRKYRDNVFVLLDFFSRSNLQAIRHKALTSIGYFCAQYSEYLTRQEVKNMYIVLLGSDDPNYLPLRIQILKNLELFLLTEEKKMIKSNEDWEKGKEQQNLKEMELAGSGLGSAVIQVYWNAVLHGYFCPNDQVRLASVQVTWQTLSQGLVTPGTSIGTLIAMTTDPLPTIRNKVENMLKDIDNKYQGMVQSTATKGVRLAYTLHMKIRTDPRVFIRGIRACDVSVTANNSRVVRDVSGLPRMSNDGQAMLSGLYQRLRTNRQQRRSFLNSVLRLFSEDSREKLRLEEWIFVADNIAMFPYQVMDEPLYAIRHIDSIVALSGQSILVQFKAQLRPSSMGQQADDDDAVFEPESLYSRFPEDKTPLYDLMDNSQACFILLYLKSFLMKLYGFTDAKVQEYSPSEAAKVYEKAVSRKNVHMFNPQSALESQRRDAMEDRTSIQSHFNLAHKICSFRKMLLSLDRMDEDGDDEDNGDAVGVRSRELGDDTDGDAEQEADSEDHVTTETLEE